MTCYDIILQNEPAVHPQCSGGISITNTYIVLSAMLAYELSAVMLVRIDMRCDVCTGLASVPLMVSSPASG